MESVVVTLHHPAMLAQPGLDWTGRDTNPLLLTYLPLPACYVIKTGRLKNDEGLKEKLH